MRLTRMGQLNKLMTFWALWASFEHERNLCVSLFSASMCLLWFYYIGAQFGSLIAQFNSINFFFFFFFFFRVQSLCFNQRSCFKLISWCTVQMDNKQCLLHLSCTILALFIFWSQKLSFNSACRKRASLFARRRKKIDTKFSLFNFWRKLNKPEYTINQEDSSHRLNDDSLNLIRWRRLDSAAAAASTLVLI